MNPQSFQAGWVAIDQTVDPAYYIRFMDKVRQGEVYADGQLCYAAGKFTV